MTKEAGLAIDQMEQAARELLRNGQFEDIDEEVPMLLEEFYPEANSDETANGINGSEATTLTSRPARQSNQNATETTTKKESTHQQIGERDPIPSPVNGG